MRIVCSQTRGSHSPSIFQFRQESKRIHLDAMKRWRDALQADTVQEGLDKQLPQLSDIQAKSGASRCLPFSKTMATVPGGTSAHCRLTLQFAAGYEESLAQVLVMQHIFQIGANIADFGLTAAHASQFFQEWDRASRPCHSL